MWSWRDGGFWDGEGDGRGGEVSRLLGRYREMGRRRMPGWLLGLMAVAWVGVTVMGFVFSEGDREVTSWAVFREADVALNLAVACEERSAFERWLVVDRTTDEMVEFLAGELGRHAEAGLLDEPALEMKKVFDALVEERLEDLDWVKLRSGVEEQGAWSWEWLAILRAHEGRVPEWFVAADLEHRAFVDEVYRWSLAGEVLWWGLFVVGLLFLPEAWKCFRVQEHRSWGLSVRVWRPGWVLGAYLGMLGITWVLFLDYWFIPEVFWEDFPGLTSWWSDAVWRLAFAVVMVGFLVVRWRDLPRLLGLDRAPKFRPILGMFALAFLYNWGLAWVLEDYGAEVVGESVYWGEDGWWGLVFAVSSGVVLAPLVEEVVFRGALFPALARGRSVGFSVVVTTVLFAFIHNYNLYGLLSVSFFGVATCFLYRATGSLWTAIFYHAFYNGMITATWWPVAHGLYSL
ncbi:MAG: type II CAAX endopeptidase family protein [Verrucomicrobiota bacterium]